MKFTISRSALLAELALLRDVVSKKSSIPVLQQLRLEAHNNGSLSLAATDLDVTLLITCNASVDGPGAVLVSAHKLFDVVRNLPEGEISVTHDNRQLLIKCCGSKFTLLTQDAEHFPASPTWQAQSVAIPAETLKSVIGRTMFAITEEESRYALNGSLFQIQDARLMMVSTDGHRLALASSNGLSDGAKFSVVVPKKALNEIVKLVDGKDKDATVGFATDENHLFFDFGERRLVSRRLAGQFPNYELVLPKNNTTLISLPTEELAHAIRRTALMADERSHGIKLELTNAALNLTAQSCDVGESDDALVVDYTGEPMHIGFNANYLLDFLISVGSERVTLALKDERSPALFTPEDGTDCRYVAMPMRLL